MNIRGIVRVLATLLVVALVVGIGIGVYNAGVTAGLSEAALHAAASGEAVASPYIYGPMGWGFGAFFGILFWIFAILLIIGLVRAAVGLNRTGSRFPEQ